MREKRVYEFLKTGDIKSSLGIGRVAEIQELFRKYDISEDRYEITETGIIVKGYLDLEATDITELPEGLSVEGSLDVMHTPLVSLPEGLNVEVNLYLYGTDIIELPKSLSVRGKIMISRSQIQLKSYIESSKFADKLEIWRL